MEQIEMFDIPQKRSVGRPKINKFKRETQKRRNKRAEREKLVEKGLKQLSVAIPGWMIEEVKQIAKKRGETLRDATVLAFIAYIKENNK